MVLKHKPSLFRDLVVPGMAAQMASGLPGAAGIGAASVATAFPSIGAIIGTGMVLNSLKSITKPRNKRYF